MENLNKIQHHYDSNVFFHHSILSEIEEKSHYEKLYALELEMKLIEEEMFTHNKGALSIYKNVANTIYKRFEAIDMLFTKLDFLKEVDVHRLLDEIDSELAKLEDKILILKRFSKE